MTVEKEYEEMKIPKEEVISSYYDLREQLRILKNEFRNFVFKPTYIVPFLQPGRMLFVGIIVHFIHICR